MLALCARIWIAIPAVEKASTVTYYDGQLFVGFLVSENNGTVLEDLYSGKTYTVSNGKIKVIDRKSVV